MTEGPPERFRRTLFCRRSAAVLQPRPGGLQFPEVHTLARAFVASVLAIAAPSCDRARSEAVTTMVGDLRLLWEVQQDTSAGASTPIAAGTATANTPLQGYAPSPGVTVIVGSTTDGWAATATHMDAPGAVCGIFAGVTPGGKNPARVPGEPRCN